MVVFVETYVECVDDKLSAGSLLQGMFAVAIKIYIAKVELKFTLSGNSVC